MSKLYNLEDSPYPLTKDHLFIKVYDPTTNTLIDPEEITASLFIKDYVTEEFELSSNPALIDIDPTRDSVGFYFLDLMFSTLLFRVGEYKVQWKIKLTPDSNYVEAPDYFVVVIQTHC